MAIIVLPFTFSAGAVIIASQHNSNFSTIYNDYNGNIDNTNIVASAGIVASKLDLTSPGAIGSTAPNTGAFSTLKIGTMHNGDIFYDNGTVVSRLVAGTTGLVLLTQGTNAAPQWGNVSVSSNFLFSYNGAVQGSTTEYSGSVLTSAGVTGNYRYLQSTGTSYVTVWTTKLVKLPGLKTATIWTRIWNNNNSANRTANLLVDIGGQNSNVSGTNGQGSPEWNSFTIDISSLASGTTCDVKAQLKLLTAGGGDVVYCSDIVGFGS